MPSKPEVEKLVLIAEELQRLADEAREKAKQAIREHAAILRQKRMKN